MKYFIQFLTIIFGVYLIGTFLVEPEINKQLEKAYYEGQLDCVAGDVRIENDSTTLKWKWIKSPWDSGKKPIFKPN